ncbi:MAG: hypothetical protein U9N52_06290 [Campylobacterota bacterium]|nr:hypothetical protein [Campylobacterota bacterium]
MKNLIYTSLLLANTLLFAQTPSQNSQLNAVSPSKASQKSDAYLQKSLDSWFQEDWEPAQKKSASEKEALHVKKKESNESHFKLQNYVKKWEDYNKQKASEPKKASHVEMLNTLPAIGK